MATETASPNKATQPATNDAPAAKLQMTPLQATLELARQGDRRVLPQLRKALDDHPEIWQELFNLSSLVEQSWIDRVSSTDERVSESIRRQITTMKADLAGPSPTALERILIERIIVSWLTVQYAELTMTAGEKIGLKVAQLQLKQLDSANKRLLAAVKALAIVRRLTGGLRIEINHIQGPAAPSAGAAQRSDAADGSAAQQNGVGDRLRDFMKVGASQESEFASMA